MSNKRNKGFIGAIGDDLPSLIPIFLGLVVFFSVFLGVFNDYNAKNRTYTSNQEAIEISMQLKSDPVIVDYTHFNDKCNKIKTTKNWNAFLVDLPLNTDNFEQINLMDVIDNYQNSVITSNVEGIENYFICNEEQENLDQLKDPSKNPIIYLYPIILQRDNGFSTTARLYVLIWE
jgi:hypothetical protein